MTKLLLYSIALASLLFPLSSFGQCANQITVSYYQNGVPASQVINNGQSGTDVPICPTAGAQYAFSGSSSSDAVLTWARVITRGATPAQDALEFLSGGTAVVAGTTLPVTASFTTRTVFRLRSQPTGNCNNKDGYAYLPLSPTLTLQSSPLNGVCAGGTATLTAAGATNGAYAWTADGVTIPNQTGSTITVSPTVTTTYTVTATTTCGTSSQQLTIPVKALTVTPAAPGICAGQRTTLTASYSGASVTSYQWSAQGSSSVLATMAAVTVAPTATTTYQVVATTSDCGTITKTVTVTIAAPTVSVAPGAVTSCSGSATTLTATSNNPNATFSWRATVGTTTTTLSATTAAITVSPTSTTTYTVTATTPSCGSTTAATTVTVANAATFATTPAPTICAGSPATLTASSNITGASYAWYRTADLGTVLTTSSTLTVSPPATTTYRVTTTTACGNNSQDVTVSVSAPPTVAVTPASATIGNGGSVVLTASGANTYSWSPATGLNTTSGASVTASPTTTTTYTVAGTSTATGCTSTRLVTVTVSAPLPVGLVAFTARREGPVILLTWSTAHELNNDYFSVERSADGRAFAELGRIMGAGTSASQRTYSYSDEHPLTALAYYRLRQVDYAGQATYSMAVAVAPPQRPANWLVTTASPRHYRIQAALGPDSHFTVLDLLGRPAFTQALSADHAEVMLPGLPAGVYLFQLTTQQGRLTVRQALTVAN